ncbi:MAG TPA: hypothetical protein PK286_08200 [Devosia sp.]|nr:hypothetical protein [Devosia sp.]
MTVHATSTPADAASARHASIQMRFDAGRIVRFVAIFAAIIWGLGLVRQVAFATGAIDSRAFGWEVISLDGEANLPSWFSGLLLFTISVTALFLAKFARIAEPRNAAWWMLLSAFFLLLSADEIVGLHEATVWPLHSIRTWTGPLLFAWVLWGVPLLALVGLLFVPLLARLPRATTLRLCIAATIGIAGAVGMEMIAGMVIDWRLDRDGYYAAAVALEEGGELTGAVLFLRGLLLHIADSTSRLTFDLRQAGSANVAGSSSRT